VFHREAVRRLQTVTRGAYLIVGPAGIGKSRVAEEWVAHLRGARPSTQVVLVHPDPTCARTSLQPIRSALAQALSISERPSLAELDLALSALKLDPGGRRSVDRPGLAELFGVWQATVPAAYDVRRRECFAAAVQTLRRLPAAFVFEDVDRYDGPSRQVLSRLCQDPGEATVLCTATAENALERGPEVLRLSPLPDEVVGALGLPPQVVQAGRGVPRDLEQAFRALAEGGREGTLSGRLQLLPAEARQLLEALAVHGTQAPIGLLAELCEVDEPRPALMELSLRGLVRVIGELVELPSPAMRDALYARIAPERRAALHRTLWRRLEERGAGPQVLAHHAHLCDPERVPLFVLERAGEAARHSFDDEEAERWFAHAWERARRLVAAGEAPNEVQVHAGLRLALTLRYADKIVEAEQMLREVLKLGRGDARAEADARRGLARLAYAWDQPAAAQHELYGAIRAAWRAGAPGLLVELYLELADVMAKAGDPAAAERELREGIDCVTSGDGIEAESGPAELWQLLLRLGELLHAGGRPAEALDLGRHALRWARRTGSPAARSKTQRFLGQVHKALGELPVAARYHQAALEEARLAGDRRSTAELLIIMADAVQRSDQSPESRDSARALLLEASSLSQQIGWGEGIKLVEQQMAELELDE
jgi:serine/threonine-protein kinase